MRPIFWISAATAAALASSGYAAPKDDLCAQLRAYEAADFQNGSDGKPIRRSITFDWIGGWLTPNMEWGCERKKADARSVALCSYLMDHTSLEFRSLLPLSVLRCYGYKFPKFVSYDWGNWTSNIKLHGEKQDRTLAMEVDLSRRSAPNGAVRISVTPENPGKDDVDLAPLGTDAPKPAE